MMTFVRYGTFEVTRRQKIIWRIHFSSNKASSMNNLVVAFEYRHFTTAYLSASLCQSAHFKYLAPFDLQAIFKNVVFLNVI